MITRELKLELTVKQERTLNEWLWNLTGVHNWAVRKIELDGRRKQNENRNRANPRTEAAHPDGDGTRSKKLPIRSKF